jgi:hypothetical protein
LKISRLLIRLLEDTKQNEDDILPIIDLIFEKIDFCHPFQTVQLRQQTEIFGRALRYPTPNVRLAQAIC